MQCAPDSAESYAGDSVKQWVSRGRNVGGFWLRAVHGFCYLSLRSKTWGDGVRALQWLAKTAWVVSTVSTLAYGRLFAAEATISDRDLADSRHVIEAVAASAEQTRLFCDWHRKQAKMVEALSGGSRRPEEVSAIAEASQVAFRKLGPAFARAHEVSSSAFFRKDERARSVNDAWSALTDKCAGG